MKYGYFDDAQKEYVITRPDTPLPWINYLGSEAFFGLISNTAGGYTFYKDARLRRLTRYRYNNAPLDMGGRYLYLRDDAAESDHPVFWSPTWMPTRSPLAAYECRHGIGYSAIRSQAQGIETAVRYFVPPGETMEIWQVTVKNGRDTAADLSLFTAVEFCLWDALDDASNYQRNYSTGQVEVWPEESLIIHKTEYRERRDHIAYFACSEPLAGFDTQRETFLGAYRGWHEPQVVEQGISGDSVAHGWQPIGSHHLRLHLQPGDEKQIIFLLGYHENPADDKFDPPGSQTVNRRTLQPVLAKYRQWANAEAAFAALQADWANLLNRFQVQTPDPDTNRMVNIWNAYQCMVTFNMSRSASYFESGIGRGMGFRDSNQDLLGIVHMIPERARERILDLSATQMHNGGAFHQYQPLTKRGNNDVGSGFNDDPLWLVVGVSAYIKETGDWAILDELVPYENEAGSETALYEHLQRAMGYTLTRRGPHGLPLIGRADWNDCLNLNCFSDTPGQSFQTTTNKEGLVAESVFIAGLFVLAAQEMADLIAHGVGQATAVTNLSQAAGHTAHDYRQAASDMEAVVWQHGWDGDWFRRAYDDDGRPLGSRENEEGQIFIEPQGMCVMAGLGLANGRAQQALDSVAEHLATPHGIVLQQPAFSQYYLHLGEISSYPPGYKENAGIFCHANPWVMIAETRAGRGDQAFDYYKRINPSAREAISDLHRCEPFVYAQMIAGKDAITHGEAKNSWLTGTAAWNYSAITHWILGIRPSLGGLRIDPVIPSDWPSFSVVRKFRGAEYHIQVRRQGAGRVSSLLVDGQPVAGDVLPIAPAGASVRVEVVIG
ncbi:MAG: glycosyl transferase [Chloroflexi bacterium]|nr:glycosyl transferase [Chloroflexota bacterium]MBP7042721.1 glycosyl transferase [Chloroflexota bacterium]